jgi:aspartate/methionine/tyrosine aminotransferase
LVQASKVDNFSELSHRLVGQEMFHILDKARGLEREGHEVIHLELGDPFGSPDAAIIEAVAQALKSHGWHYTSSGGEHILRAEISEFLKDYFSATVSIDSITIAPANYLITNFLSITCNAGDTVLLVTPCFPSYIASAKMLGINILECPTNAANGYALKGSIVEKILTHKPKAIIVNSANNPTGAVYSKEILDQILQAAQSIDAYVLSDETYGLLTYDKGFKTLINEDYDRLVVLSSFSKILSIPGLRLGFQVSRSKKYNEFSEKYLSTTISCIPPFIQKGCAAFLQHKERVKNTLDTLRSHYAIETEMIFKEVPILSQWMKIPSSAFYLFIPLPWGVDGSKFALNLINESHVAVTPGISFGSDFNCYVRVATCGEGKQVLKGIRLLVEAIKKIQPR